MNNLLRKVEGDTNGFSDTIVGLLFVIVGGGLAQLNGWWVILALIGVLLIFYGCFSPEGH